MPNCCVKSCKNYSSKVKKCNGVSYHRFPNDPVKKDIWSRIIRKERNDPYFKPHKCSRLCSAHFLEKDCVISKTGLRRLKGSAIPRLALQNSVNVKNQSSGNDTQSSQMEEIDVDITDLHSIFDSPREVKLKKRVTHLEKRISITAKKVKKLQKENAKLKKKNKSLIDIVKDLKKKNYITEQMDPVVSQSTT